jgi:hypothetical protein
MTGSDERNSPERQDLSELVESRQPGVLSEFWQFLTYNKKWWLLPLLIALLLLGLLVILSGSGLAPFIYPFA